MSDHDLDMNASSSLDLVTVPAPPVYLFTMMGIWASLTGLLGITANILAIGVFFRVKRVFKCFICPFERKRGGNHEGVFVSFEAQF